ncbi:MAG: ABC transporter permease [Ilumatobacter sp.]
MTRIDDAPAHDGDSTLDGDVPPAEATHRVHSLLLAVAPVLGLAAVFIGWEAYVRLRDLRPLTLPRPSDIFIHVFENPSFYWENGLVTLTEASAGFVIAFIVAVLAATVMAHSRFMERAGLPVIVLIQSTPIAVLVPVFLLWFGFSPWPKILTAALFAWVPFVANALTGLRAIDPDTHELLRSTNASSWEIFWKLRVPHALPYLFSAARICIGLALVGAVIGEFFNSSEGLGNAARVGQSQPALNEQLWGSVFVLAFIGVVAVLVLAAIERRVLRWHPSQSLI